MPHNTTTHVPALAADGVILLHGIGRTSASMARLERALRAAGYRTLNITYASRAKPLEGLVAEIHPQAAEFAARHERVHVVTHSMGGLVARALIATHRPERLARVVMLAPPNNGSEVADLLARWPLYHAYFGPAGAQLMTRRDERLRALLGAVDYPLGIIAGTRSIDLLSSLFVLPGRNDGKVTVASTMVEGMSDHLILPVTHTLMMRNRAVIEQVIHFLHFGKFTDTRMSRRA